MNNNSKNKKEKIDNLLNSLDELSKNFLSYRCSEEDFDKNLTDILANLRKNFDNLDDKDLLNHYLVYLKSKDEESIMRFAFNELVLSLNHKKSYVINDSIEEDIDGLTQHIINVSNDFRINLDKETALKIRDFCVSGIAMENFFDESKFTDIANTVSKKDILGKLEKDYEVYFSDSKIRKLYKTMNKMRETIFLGNTTDTKAKLTPFEARGLEIFILNEKDAYMKFLSKLNSNDKTVPKVPNIEDARLLKEKIIEYYEENPIEGNPVEHTKELENLFNSRLIEDTYHFDVFFLYTQLIDTLKEGILKTVVEAQSKGMFKNNFLLIILLQREIELAKEYVDNVENRLEKSIELIQNIMYTEKNNFLNESQASSEDSLNRMNNIMDNIDVNHTMSNETFKEVISAFYGETIDPETFIK